MVLHFICYIGLKSRKQDLESEIDTGFCSQKLYKNKMSLHWPKTTPLPNPCLPDRQALPQGARDKEFPSLEGRD
ncbi:MAG: hypothetical protein A2X59_06545 [Nitrospirae bacterium GWC2_42_7]|nr:MAG: hypothetical protein A2X59_06545 [Nitrospirae bacterium GWC2_42_7]